MQSPLIIIILYILIFVTWKYLIYVHQSVAADKAKIKKLCSHFLCAPIFVSQNISQICKPPIIGIQIRKNYKTAPIKSQLTIFTFEHQYINPKILFYYFCNIVLTILAPSMVAPDFIVGILGNIVSIISFSSSM